MIYIVIEQRLLFLVFMIFNLSTALVYSLYFFLKWKKSSSKSTNSSNNNDDDDDDDNNITEITIESGE